MAKRRYQKRKRKQKTSLKAFYSFLAIVACFFAAITVNTYAPFTRSLPTWEQIRAEVGSMLEDASYPQGYVDGEVTVHYIDVGQGNCTLIRTKEHAVLIDAGENDQGETVVSYLKGQGIEKIDYAIATHPHSDHIGGLDVVIREIPTENIIMPKLKKSLIPTTRTYEDLLTAIQENNVNVITAKVGEQYEIDGGILTILGPAGDFNDLNNISVGARFSYGDVAFLSTGDMEEQAEEALLNTGERLSADVFLAGHHGSDTANSEAFLKAVGAEYFVVQCGYQNQYGHPHKEILRRMEQLGGEILRTDVSGTIVFSTDGTQLDLQTEK